MLLRDLTNQRFGRLIVLKRDLSTKHKVVYWICKCDCGAKKSASSGNLTGGRVQSCGCLRQENTKNFPNKNWHNHHGTRLYKIWAGMKTRCFNTNSAAYKDYGARGITVCDEWKTDPVPFIDWAMVNGYRKDLTIDRIDVNGNYAPFNCRFVAQKEQCNNRRNNLLVEHDGEVLTLMQLSEKTGIKYYTLWGRLKQNLKGDDLVKPSGYYSDFTGENNKNAKLNEEQVKEIKMLLQSKKHSIAGISRMFNIGESAIRRIRDEEAWKHVVI